MNINDIVLTTWKILKNNTTCDIHRGFADFPKNIIIKQDRDLETYAGYLPRLLVATDVEVQNPEKILLWQVLQTYRVLNAAISSESDSLDQTSITGLSDRIRDELINLRVELESSSPLKEYLEEIDSSEQKPDIICSGHGGWETTDNFIESEEEVSVFIYSGIGATLGAELSYRVESERVDPNLIVIRDKNTNERSLPKNSNEVFPKQLTSQAPGRIPNFYLRDLGKTKWRIIEAKTGRILDEGYNSIQLQTIIDKFPNRKIHWGVCTQAYHRDSEKVKTGAFLGKRWTVVRPTKKHELQQREREENEAKKNKTNKRQS